MEPNIEQIVAALLQDNLEIAVLEAALADAMRIINEDISVMGALIEALIDASGNEDRKAARQAIQPIIDAAIAAVKE